ncbi:MAG TPA: hypothetical protein VIV61_08085 [Candidatus Ozemobacteraceae bacterium]
MMRGGKRFAMAILLAGVLTTAPASLPAAAPAGNLAPEELTSPYQLNRLLSRGEELFQNNNYREAVIFYYEALSAAADEALKAKIHFRIGECLEGVRRFEFAGYHYKLAIRSGRLTELLRSRAGEKLRHLPKMAQHEEALRLFNKAMAAYRRRDVRGCIDDYLESLRLEPSLMAQDNSNLLDDAIQYLTFVSETKEKEPERLLKLATLMELRGDTEKAIETLKQILIIYPNAPVAREAEEKVAFYTQKRTSYLEVRRPRDAMPEVQERANPVLHETSLEFVDPGTVSKDLAECAYTFRASNESSNIPEHRFESFTVTLGKGENQKEYVFRAEEGISDRKLVHEGGDATYTIEFTEVNLTTAYIQDIYGEGVRSTQLFSGIKLNLTVTRP